MPWSQRYGIMVRALALHAYDLGLIPSIPYSPLTCQE